MAMQCMVEAPLFLLIRIFLSTIHHSVVEVEEVNKGPIVDGNSQGIEEVDTFHEEVEEALVEP